MSLMLVNMKATHKNASMYLYLPVKEGFIFDPDRLDDHNDGALPWPEAVGVFGEGRVTGEVLWDGEELHISWSDDDKTVLTHLREGMELYKDRVFVLTSTKYPEVELRVERVELP